MVASTRPTNARGKIGAAALAIIGAAIALEGGYVNHKSDPGGETNMGVTVQVARENGYSGPMRTLPRDVAEGIYYKRYLVGPGLEPLIAIDAAVTEELFDTTVNMGPSRPSRWFQQGLNDLCASRVAVDGKIGGQSIGAFATCQKKLGATRLCRAMLDSLDAQQKAEYGRLVRVNGNLSVFYKGWIAHRIGNVDRKKCGTAPA
jgi:lysozyme family protein